MVCGPSQKKPEEKRLCMCCMRGLRHLCILGQGFNSCVASLRRPQDSYLKAREKMFYQLRLVLALEHILSRTTPRRQRPS